MIFIYLGANILIFLQLCTIHREFFSRCGLEGRFETSMMA